MTKKYAKVKADGGSSSSLQIKIHEDKKLSEPGTSVLASNQEKPTVTVNHNTASQGVPNSQLLLSRDQQEDQNGKRKAMTGFDDADTFPNDGTKPSRKKLSLTMSSQSQNKHLSKKELTNEASDSCKANKKLSLGLRQPLDNNLASSSFRASGPKSDTDTTRLRPKLSLRSLGESQLNEVSKNSAESNMEQEMNQDQDGKSCCGEVENSGLEKTTMSESIVVLDSDDSGEEEEVVSIRSRLSLGRRSVRGRR